MIARLLVSALLVWLVILAVDAAGSGWSRDLRGLIVLTAALVLGYHRQLHTPGERPAWLWPRVPATEKVGATNSLWGIPLGRARTLRMTVNMRLLAERRPVAVAIAECFPALLTRPVRRLLTRAGGAS